MSLIVPLIMIGCIVYKYYTISSENTSIHTCSDGQCEYMTVINSTDDKEAANQLLMIYKKVLPVYNAMRLRPGFRDPGPLKPSDLLESDGYRTNDSKTTYTFDKSTLHVCLREKSGALYSESQVKFNRIMYVVFHEITHKLTTSWDHTPEFWSNFHLVLKEAVRQGSYTPENFSKSNWTHCGKSTVTVGGDPFSLANQT